MTRLQEFWKGRRVFLTGATGFKGSWLALWLHDLGADVIGYSLDPPTRPSLFEMAEVSALLAKDIRADIRDLVRLTEAMVTSQPDVVFHLAAQPLVRESYSDPVGTFSTNVMGSIHLMEAVRAVASVRAVVMVTTDKCYENQEWPWAYRENEPMGGYDPYSSSKGCAELAVSAYRRSFFSETQYGSGHHTAVASARAGNVIGGGDFAKDRLIPDIVGSIKGGRAVVIRSPTAVRPWQHVLEPLSGYLILAQRLFEAGPAFAEGWNFGPDDNDAQPVEKIAKSLMALWPSGGKLEIQGDGHLHEANYLKLDCSKAKGRLGWRPTWNLDTALQKIYEWTADTEAGTPARDVLRRQIQEFMSSGSGEKR